MGCYVPLKLRQVRKTGRRGRPLINTLWVVADKTLVPPRLQGAVARIRHNPTKHERDADKSHSRALRIFPESDERFDDIFGRREDSESANSDLKNRLWNSRCRHHEPQQRRVQQHLLPDTHADHRAGRVPQPHRR